MKHITSLFILLLVYNICMPQTLLRKSQAIKVTLQFDKKITNSELTKYTGVISKRLESFSHEKPSIIIDECSVRLSIKSEIDTTALKTILLNQGKLEIWPTYDNGEIFQFMNEINHTINDLGLSNRFINDTSQVSREFPFFNKLLPFIDNDGALIDGPFAGMAYGKDKSLIDSVLALSQVKDQLLRDLKFYWYFQSINNYFPLIAINTQNKTNAIITTRMINNVFVKKDLEDKYNVGIELQIMYFDLLRTESEYNIAKSLAILVDGTVYSIKKLTSVIEDGEILLAGKYNKDEANLLAAILAKGELTIIPISIIIEAE